MIPNSAQVQNFVGGTGGNGYGTAGDTETGWSATYGLGPWALTKA